MFRLFEKFGGIIIAIVALVLVVLFSILPTSCSSDRPPVQGSIDRAGKPIEVTVLFYDSVREVRDAYALAHSVSPNTVDGGLQGFAQWPEWRGEEPADAGYECTIHTVRPQRVDDRHTLTLGHEMLHCLLGTYHE